jgi:hypothetical protein
VNESDKDPIQEFRDLCEQAEIVYSRPDSCGDPDLIPFGRRILALIAHHSARQADFDQAFRDLWNHKFTGPWELIPFCMHYLRWSGFRDFIERIRSEALRSNDWRCIPVAQQVLDCFSDDWDGLERFYANSHDPGNA